MQPPYRDWCVSSDAVLHKKLEGILTIKGLGLVRLATIIAETDGLALRENHSQITSYAGYDGVENQSGKRIGRTRAYRRKVTVTSAGRYIFLRSTWCAISRQTLNNCMKEYRSTAV